MVSPSLSSLAGTESKVSSESDNFSVWFLTSEKSGENIWKKENGILNLFFKVF